MRLLNAYNLMILKPAPTKDVAKLNKLETSWHLILRCNHSIEAIYVQAFTLKLGDDCRYTPDFLAINKDGSATFYECKGFMRDDALVKLKVAARQFSMFKFVLVTRVKGTWVQQEISA